MPSAMQRGRGAAAGFQPLQALLPSSGRALCCFSTCAPRDTRVNHLGEDLVSASQHAGRAQRSDLIISATEEAHVSCHGRPHSIPKENQVDVVARAMPAWSPPLRADRMH